MVFGGDEVDEDLAVGPQGAGRAFRRAHARLSPDTNRRVGRVR